VKRVSPKRSNRSEGKGERIGGREGLTELRKKKEDTRLAPYSGVNRREKRVSVVFF
jgi:hypothetical protein